MEHPTTDKLIMIYNDETSICFCDLDHTGDVNEEINMFLGEPNIFECNIELNKRMI